MHGRHRTLRWAALGVLALALVLVPFFLFGAGLEAWALRCQAALASRPLAVALVLGGLLATDIFLPVPSSIVSTACGNLLGFWAGLATSLAGMTVSCVAGFWVGYAGGRPLARRLVGERDLQRLHALSERFGDWVVMAARPVPVLAEVSVLFAGVGRMRPARFLLFSTLANLGISAGYAYIGAFAAEVNSFLLAFAGAILVPLAGMLVLGLNPSARRRVYRDGED